ncbi:carbohydrate ABC transporter membrane protein 1, CUT1 family [Plantibacter flavus]|uniref:Carbohydrate ABC transporter membrane protein 1 (CUT1 family) n=2 Tax=Plantibacter flavus TaxID=150123 RepID=A0A3N2C2H2_9MICO|nr:carbohydrate ABC transporter membrane protein 1 (CUT1 family) [Plantibacter flavus]SMG16046.1 carbohydrate ABC transporter membrane protein 1, CUT1 family [Plantibacter flavus]
MTLTMKREPEVRTGTTESATTTGRKRRRASHQRQGWVAHVFLLPWMLGMVAVTAGPLIASAVLAFTDYDLLTAPSFIGFDNFTRMMGDERFWASARVTGLYVLVSVPLQLAFALFLAVILDKGIRGLSLYRSAFYLPSLLGGSVAIAILWRQLFGDAGLINTVLGFFGIEADSWLQNPATAPWTLIILNVWTFGSPMVIFLAGLRQVPDELLEAAEVDGAGRMRRFWSITIPLLTPIIFLNLILQMISAFQAFTQAHVVSGGTGGPLDSTLFYTLYIYQEGFVNFDMGYAAAMAWVLLIVIAIATAGNFILSRRWVHYGDE